MTLLVRLLMLNLTLFGIGCAHVRAECSAHGGPVWREVTSEHFVVATDLDSEMARLVVLDLERARTALLLTFRTQADPPQKLRAIVLRSRSELAEFGDSQVLGFMTFDKHGPLIVASGTGYFIASEPDINVATHEIAHLFEHYSFAHQPRWFGEGLAAYLETMTPDRRSNQMVLGEAHLPHFSHVRSRGALGLRDLWAWDRTQLSPSDAYASSWIWVHFLMNRHGDELGQFEIALASAKDAREAWAKAFANFTDQQLESELQTYIHTGSYSVLKIDLGNSPQTIRERNLSNADVHALRAQIAQARFHNPKTAEQKKLIEEDVTARSDAS